VFSEVKFIALSCKKQRHAWLNDLIHRALIRAETPTVKEPQGLSRDNGKRPDGLTLVPWQSGRSATWDVTAAYTLATSYVSQNALQAGSVASARKKTKYSTLSASRHVFSVAVETLGSLSDEAHSLIAEIGRRATLCTADQREYVPVPTYFRGNSAFQRRVPCQYVHSSRVPIITTPDIHFCLC